MVGVLGKFGKHGRTTLYVEDVQDFYLKEDIPRGYERREAPVSFTRSEINKNKRLNKLLP